MLFLTEATLAQRRGRLGDAHRALRALAEGAAARREAASTRKGEAAQII